MSQDELQALLDAAYKRGLTEGVRQAADAAEERVVADADARQDLERDDSEQGDQRRALFGPSEDDTCDSRGEMLRPKVNEAGEPFWM